MDIDGENWFPVNFCFLVPKESKKFKEYEHQTAGVYCMHHKIRGEIIEIPLRPCEEKVMNRMFSRMNISDQNHMPHYKVIKRVISYLKLPVNAVERRVDLVKKRDYNDVVNCEMAFAEALGASPDVSHEAWQWVDVTGGNFSRVPALKQYVGQRVLLIYPNSD